jgi:acyl-CoA thioesterase-1
MRSLRGAVAAALGVMAMACSSNNGSARDTATAIKSPDTTEGSTAARSAVDSSAGGRRTIVFLGTSLTAGYGLDPDSAFPQLIQRKIDASALPYQIVNAGVSGETSAGLLRRLDWVLQRPAEVIVVETGANDGLRALPVSATEATIGDILTRIRRTRPAAAIYLVQMEAPTNLGREYTAAFHAIYGALARAHGATLLPFLLDSVAGRPTLNQADGIHPNYVGERIVAENVWRGLKPALSR